MPSGPQPLSQLKTPYWMVLVFGGTGIGKTCLAGSSQRMRTFIIDCDQGAHSIIPYCKSRGLKYEHITAYPVTNRQEFTQALAYFQSNMRSYDLLVIDTVTELHRFLLQEICDGNRHVAPDQRDWGAILTLMEKIVTGIRFMPVHSVLLAHEKTTTDNETGRTHYHPSFKGSFQHEHEKHFSEIWRYVLLERQIRNADQSLSWEQQRWIQCHRLPTTFCKDRSAALDPWEPPDIDALFAKLIASTSSAST